MILSQVKSEEKSALVADLEQKMARIRVFHKLLGSILEAEYVAGMANDLKSLKKLSLRKRNCVNRFEGLVRSMGEQIGRSSGQKKPSNMPGTLADHVKMIQGLTPKQEDILVPIANDLDKRHLELMKTAARNASLFKRVIDRLAVTSRYVDHRNMGRTP